MVSFRFDTGRGSFGSGAVCSISKRSSSKVGIVKKVRSQDPQSLVCFRKNSSPANGSLRGVLGGAGIKLLPYESCVRTARSRTRIKTDVADKRIKESGNQGHDRSWPESPAWWTLDYGDRLTYWSRVLMTDFGGFTERRRCAFVHCACLMRRDYLYINGLEYIRFFVVIHNWTGLKF